MSSLGITNLAHTFPPTAGQNKSAAVTRGGKALLMLRGALNSLEISFRETYVFLF